MPRAPTNPFFMTSLSLSLSPFSLFSRISDINATIREEKERTMPIGYQASLVDIVDQTCRAKGLDFHTRPSLFVSGTARMAINDDGYERCLQKEKLCPRFFFFFSFSFFFSPDHWTLGTYKILSFIPRQLLGRESWHARRSYVRTLSSVSLPRGCTPLSDLQHCPKNTAILSQILFGFSFTSPFR